MNKKINKNPKSFKIRLASVILCASLVVIGSAYAGGIYFPANIYNTEQTDIFEKTDETNITTPSDAADNNTDNKQETSKPSNLTKEEKEVMQKGFDDLCMDFFKDQITYSLINLHFTVKDNNNFGISEYPVSYGDISYEQIIENEEKREEIKKQLNQYMPDDLRDDQQLTYKVLNDYIDIEESSDGMELYYEPLMPTVGMQAQLPILLSEYEFNDLQDVEDYLELLGGIDEYYQQIMDFEKEKSQAGLFMSDEMADKVIESCDGYLLSPNGNFMTETFEERLEKVEGLSKEKKEELIDQDNKYLDNDFANAYDILREGLTDLKGTGKNNQGLYYYPEGQKYCEYLIKSYSGTSYDNIDDLKAAIEERLDNDFKVAAGVTADGNLSYDFVNSYSFSKKTPREIISYLENKTKGIYPELPSYTYNIRYIPKSLEATLSPAFYVTTPIDDSYSNIIYINNSSPSDNLYNTLAHEAIPGHMLQNIYYNSISNTPVRSIVKCSGYTEGWATYAEIQSYYLDDELTKDEATLLAKNKAAQLGLYAHIDLDINYYGATRKDIKKYLNEYYNIQNDSVINSIYDMMVENPCNYLKYYIGYMEIMNMKEQTMAQTGSDFNELAFNKFILDMGPASFRTIMPYFISWLMLQ